VHQRIEFIANIVRLRAADYADQRRRTKIANIANIVKDQRPDVSSIRVEANPSALPMLAILAMLAMLAMISEGS
jgi:hypothetical protein